MFLVFIFSQELANRPQRTISAARHSCNHAIVVYSMKGNWTESSIRSAIAPSPALNFAARMTNSQPHTRSCCLRLRIQYVGPFFSLALRVRPNRFELAGRLRHSATSWSALAQYRGFPFLLGFLAFIHVVYFEKVLKIHNRKICYELCDF